MENKKLQMPLMIGIGALAFIMLVLVIISAMGGINKKGRVTKATDVKESEIEEIKDYPLSGYSSSGEKVAKPQANNDSTNDVTTADYVIATSVTTAVDENALKDLTPKQLTYARNEIYARHGKKFESSELQNYFNGKSWYAARDGYSDGELSSMENANASFILKYQQDNNKTYTPN